MTTFRLPSWLSKNAQFVKANLTAAYSRYSKYQNSSKFKAWLVGHTMTGTMAKPIVLIPAITAVQVFGFGGKEANKNEILEKLNNDVISKADLLHVQSKSNEVYDLLILHKDCDNDEILWRLARAAFDKSKIVKNSKERRNLVSQGVHYAERALEINGKNFACHKWYAILGDAYAELEGAKARIINSFQALDHFMIATELNPDDAKIVYSIGYWYFSYADLPWYQRKICSVVLAQTPHATYEQALEYFERAEQIDPGFYSKNTLMIGTMYARLQQKDKAIRYLKKVLKFPVKTLDDKEAHEEAAHLLRSLGVNV